MAINVGDVIEASARMEWQGVEDIVNVFQFKCNTLTSSDPDDIITDLRNQIEYYYTPIVTGMNNSVIFRDISFRNLSNNEVYGAYPWPNLVGGTGGITTMVSGTAGLVNFATGVAKVILKKYFGVFVSTVLENDGSFNSSLMAALTIVINRMLEDITGASGTYNYGYLSPKTLQFEVPLVGTTSEIPAYQRRRKAGRGS